MKTLALALLVALAAHAGADDVVAASKAAKAKKKSSTTRVITNADVKKSKGKVAQNAAPTAPADPQPAESTMERYEAARRARAALERQLADAEKKVVDLEKELAAVEQQYYEENDLDRRDREITARFAETKTQLDAARVTRDALAQQLDRSPTQ